MCGFTNSIPSPFHFGGIPLPPELVRGRRSFPRCPPPTTEDGKGLRARAAPDVRGSKDAWLEQIHKLSRLENADLPLLKQVADWVRHGVKTVFKAGPPTSRYMRNSRTFEDNLGVCKERMAMYEALGSLRQLSQPPPPGGHVQPLHAVVKDGKKVRVCVDLSRNFNDWVEDQPFSMASVQHAVDLSLEAGGEPFYVKLDLAACFLSFPIHPDDLDFFYCEAGGDYYQFLSLVFGRKDAPRVASQLLDVVSSAMTDVGIAHVRYLDDFFLVGTTAARVWACAHRAADMLAQRFGLALSPKKVEGPAQRLEFLGIVIDSQAKTLSISHARQCELMALLQAFAKRRHSSVRRLQSLLGKLSFAATVLPGARPFLRRIIDLIAGRSHGKVRLGAAFKMEVRYWRSHLGQWNGRAAWLAPMSEPIVFASDASTSGFGYGLESCPQEVAVALPCGSGPGAVRMGVWSVANGDAARQHHSGAIQWGEFFAPLAAAVEYGSRLANRHVLFIIDNESDVAVINRQRTREPRLAELLRALSDVALRYNISFAAAHRPGVDNVLMDWASRPELHGFARFPQGSWSVREKACESVLPHPPLLTPTSISLINSRCLSFRDSNSASWTSTAGGW